ncbi:MAG: glycerol-3-phosphate transporter, partial [Ottowia sp.]|nr:glycerol-3-phosphate transporter [Ottowia sp.]
MMVERRPVLDFVAHAVLIVGVCIIAFPVYLAFVASTQTAAQIASSHPMSLIPGDNVVHSYRLALWGGKVEGGGTIAPGWPM